MAKGIPVKLIEPPKSLMSLGLARKVYQYAPNWTLSILVDGGTENLVGRVLNVQRKLLLNFWRGWLMTLYGVQVHSRDLVNGMTRLGLYANHFEVAPPKLHMWRTS
jgi:hypothetical protein